MKFITLTQGFTTCVDDNLYDILASVKWQVKPHGRTYYAFRTARGIGYKKTVYLHHAVIGKPENGLEVDHIDKDGLNNTRKNLRIVTHSENMRNRNYGSSSHVGVIWDSSRNQWQARLNGKFIGRFTTEEEAISALR